jgi:hypothetical protein
LPAQVKYRQPRSDRSVVHGFRINSTNLMSLPISASGTNIFFRLVYP